MESFDVLGQANFKKARRNAVGAAVSPQNRRNGFAANGTGETAQDQESIRRTIIYAMIVLTGKPTAGGKRNIVASVNISTRKWRTIAGKVCGVSTDRTPINMFGRVAAIVFRRHLEKGQPTRFNLLENFIFKREKLAIDIVRSGHACRVSKSNTSILRVTGIFRF